MKKFLTAFIAVLMVIPALCFVGCKKEKNVNMTRYFQSKVNYSLYPSQSPTEDDKKIEDFLDGKANNMLPYTSIVFNGDPNWLYMFNLEKITFKVHSNYTQEVQFTVVISNLKDGDQSAVGGDSEFTAQVPVKLFAGADSKVEVKVNDYFMSNGNPCTIRIKLTDPTPFEQEGEKTNFKWDILNFQIYGKTIKK